MSSSATRRIRVVCVSDTHNEDPTSQIPDGDVFIHAGDMTDYGVPDALEQALGWIRKLPHKLKIVIAGNHDMGLAPSHQAYNAKCHELFRSPSARADGVVYLDPADPTYRHEDLLSIYANPGTPDFLKRSYGFTYRPHPAPDAEAAWSSAPDTSRGPLELWVMHGPPKGRLDTVGPFPFNLYMKGCEVQARKIATAKPLVCVFGHFHYSHGVERVTWKEGAKVKGVSEVETSRTVAEDGVLDFTDLKPGKETAFINAAWMTGLNTRTSKRNRPIAFDLQYTPA